MRMPHCWWGVHPQTVAIWAKQDLIPKTARGCANMAKRLELPDPAAAQAPPLFQERRQKQIADADAALAAGRSHREIGVLVSRTTRTIKGWIQMGLIGKERAC